MLAAALGRIALSGGDRVALDFVAGGDATRPVPASGGRDAFERLTGHLESATPEGSASLQSFERALAPTLRHARRGAAVVLFSDLLDLPEGAEDLVASLCTGGRAVCVVRVMDPAELEFPFQGPVALRALEDFPFEPDGDSGRMKAPASSELRALLDSQHLPFQFVPDATDLERPAWTEEREAQFEAVKRWFYQDWLRIDNRLRTSIVEGISVFLSLFDDSPHVKHVFCPPKECYDPERNRPSGNGAYPLGRPLPRFSQLIDEGKVCALNFPVSLNPGLAKALR